MGAASTVQLIIAALGLAGELAPYAIEGIKALVSTLQTHEADGRKLTLQDVDDMAAEHGVDFEHLVSKLEEAR